MVPQCLVPGPGMLKADEYCLLGCIVQIEEVWLGYILLQVLISLSSSIGYWQLLLAASVATMPPTLNLVYPGTSSEGVKEEGA